MVDESGLVAAVRRLSAARTEMPHAVFLALVEREVQGEMPPKEWAEVVDFASDQSGRWQARWAFSPAASPDVQAKNESEAWERAFESFLGTFAKAIPDVRAPVERRHDSTALGYALRRRVDNTSGRPLARLVSVAQSKLGILAKRIGMRGLGHRLYARGLYPKGTVGRSGG